MSVGSKYTRGTGSSCTSTSSSSARIKALAEAAAAKKQAEFYLLMAEKENEEKQREFRLEQMRALHEPHMAKLESGQKKAVADDKLQAIEQSIREEEILLDPNNSKLKMLDRAPSQNGVLGTREVLYFASL